MIFSFGCPSVATQNLTYKLTQWGRRILRFAIYPSIVGFEAESNLLKGTFFTSRCQFQVRLDQIWPS